MADNSSKRIYHIAMLDEVEHAARSGSYAPESLRVEGFIHCSYAHQIRGVAEAKFRGRDKLALLEIDRSRLDASVVDENLFGGSERFPHLYGSLPMTAVLSIREIAVPEHGFFELPCVRD